MRNIYLIILLAFNVSLCEAQIDSVNLCLRFSDGVKDNYDQQTFLVINDHSGNKWKLESDSSVYFLTLPGNEYHYHLYAKNKIVSDDSVDWTWYNNNRTLAQYKIRMNDPAHFKDKDVFKYVDSSFGIWSIRTYSTNEYSIVNNHLKVESGITYSDYYWAGYCCTITKIEKRDSIDKEVKKLISGVKKI